MKMVCDRCWERNCQCGAGVRAADRQKIISDFAKSEGLPDGWQPGQRVSQKQERVIWYVVGELSNPGAEPFCVMSVDTSIKREGGVEGTVVSLHWRREEAERIVQEFNNGPLS